MIEVLAASSAGASALYGFGSAIGSLVVLAVLKWGYAQVQKNLNEGRQETAETLTKILNQTTATNGRVTVLEHGYMEVRERLAHVEGAQDSTHKMFESITRAGTPGV